jgi:hypothetical protein
MAPPAAAAVEQERTVADDIASSAELPPPPRLRPGTSTVIDGVKVLTSEGPIVEGSDEHERLLDELLFGNGFFIAKGALPPEMCAHARSKLLARGETLPLDGGGGKRLHNIIEDDPVFSELVVETHSRVGDMLGAVMGAGHYLGSYHALTQYRNESRAEPEVEELLSQGSGCHSDFPGHQGTAGHLDGLEPRCKRSGWWKTSRKPTVGRASFPPRTSSATDRARRRTGSSLRKSRSARRAVREICSSISGRSGTHQDST